MDAHKILSQLNFERLAGSSGEQRAADILAEYSSKLNLNFHREPFQLNSFNTGEARIKIGKHHYQAHPFGLNQTMEIKGELIFLENAQLIFHNRSAFKNKIIISKTYARKYQDILKQGEVKAFILIGKPFKQAHSISLRQKRFKQGYIPSMVVNYDDGVELSKLSGESVEIVINQNVELRTANNLIMDIAGEGLDDNLVIACAHYDTVARSPGITDNGGGAVTLLKIAEYFSQHPPRRDLRLIWFSGEELGLLGSYHYVQQHLAEIKQRLMMVINVDVAGDDLGINDMVIIGTRELLGYAAGITREQGIFFNTSLDLYSSDGIPFSVYEIPSINLGRYGGKASFHVHTSGDNPEYVSSRGLNPIINSSINILDHSLNAEIFPFPPKIDAELKEKLERYLWQSTVSPPILHWTPPYQQ